MGSSLSADGTLDGFLTVPDTVLLHNDGNALIAETVSTGEHGPLTNTNKMCYYSQIKMNIQKFRNQFCVFLLRCHLSLLDPGNGHRWDMVPD